MAKAWHSKLTLTTKHLDSSVGGSTSPAAYFLSAWQSARVSAKVSESWQLAVGNTFAKFCKCSIPNSHHSTVMVSRIDGGKSDLFVWGLNLLNNAKHAVLKFKIHIIKHVPSAFWMWPRSGWPPFKMPLPDWPLLASSAGSQRHAGSWPPVVSTSVGSPIFTGPDQGFDWIWRGKRLTCHWFTHTYIYIYIIIYTCEIQAPFRYMAFIHTRLSIKCPNNTWAAHSHWLGHAQVPL